MSLIQPPTVTINIRGLTQFRKELASGTSNVVQRILKVWEYRYKGFVFKRFNLFSRGGGNWPKLSEATIARRRTGSGKGSPAILVDMGLLRNALTPTTTPPPGWQSKPGPWEVEVGYGGAAAHGSGGKATIADIASFHNAGAGHLPKRQIIVAPSAEVINGMQADAHRIANERGGELTGN